MEIFTTDLVAQPQRADFWQSLVCDHLLDASAKIDAVDAGPIYGAISAHDLGCSKIMTVVSPKNFVERNQCRVRRAAHEFTLLLLQLSGTAVFAQNGRVTQMKPGELALYDSSLPHTLNTMEDYSAIVVRIPRQELVRRISFLHDVTAISIPTQTGMGRVARSLMTSLIEESSQIDDDTGTTMSDALLDTLSAVVNSISKRSHCKISTNQKALLSRVLKYIDLNLAEEFLSPNHIASAHGISTRYLNKLLESEDTSVTRWVRHQRLERCAKELRMPNRVQRTIGEIAYFWGFNSLAYFSREFYGEFDCSPKEYRKRYSKCE